MKLTGICETLRDFDGNEYHDTDKQPLTFKAAMIKALNAGHDGYEKPDGNAKLERYRIAKRLHDSGDDTECTADEIVLIKKLVGWMYIPAVSGQFYEWIESTGGKDNE